MSFFDASVDRAAGLLTKFINIGAPPIRPPFLDGNDIKSVFRVEPEFYTTAGPGLVWKVHKAKRKKDEFACSVFVLDKNIVGNMVKPTKQKGDKDLMIDCLKNSVAMLHSIAHPRMLQILHPIVEGATTLAFASELVTASLHDILAWQESNPLKNHEPLPTVATSYSPPPLVEDDEEDEPPRIEDYWFEAMQIRYGVLQIAEALEYLHYEERVVHRNVCPHVILVDPRGCWKLFGLDFIEPIAKPHANYMIGVPPYNIKLSKIAQPHLDYMAPEAQINGRCNSQSDMFSLGLIACAVFNSGRPLIQARRNPMIYIKHYKCLQQQLLILEPKIPVKFRETVTRLLARDPFARPTPMVLPVSKYFKLSYQMPATESMAAINALQFLDSMDFKSPHLRMHFYRFTLMESIKIIPKKIIWMHVWPALVKDLKISEVQASVVVPIMWLVKGSTREEFEIHLIPTLRSFLSSARTVTATIVILQNMHLIMDRCKNAGCQLDMMPILVSSLNNSSVMLRGCTLLQIAGLTALTKCAEFIDNELLQTCVLNKVKMLLERSTSDVKIISMVLSFYEKVLERLEQRHLVDHVIPSILLMKIKDPEIINRVVNLVKTITTDSKYGISTIDIAHDLLPTLAPYTVNSSLSIEQYNTLIEILYDLLAKIDVYQRAAMTEQRIPTIQPPARNRLSVDQLPTETIVFSIPNLRSARDRKASSAEDMARKASASGPTIQPTPSQSSVGTGIKKIGQWFFGSNNSTNSNNNDNNFLRVASNILPNRRLSDNTMLKPRQTAAGPSSSSTPGCSPGSASALPSRRHSSIGSQERRLSHANLSPPTAYQRGRGGSGASLTVPVLHSVGGSMPNASTSAPYLGASNTSVASRRDSRRPSACPSTASHVSQVSHASHVSRASHVSHRSQVSQASGSSTGLIQQIQTGVSQLFTGRT